MLQVFFSSVLTFQECRLDAERIWHFEVNDELNLLLFGSRLFIRLFLPFLLVLVRLYLFDFVLAIDLNGRRCRLGAQSDEIRCYRTCIICVIARFQRILCHSRYETASLVTSFQIKPFDWTGNGKLFPAAILDVVAFFFLPRCIAGNRCQTTDCLQQSATLIYFHTFLVENIERTRSLLGW